MIRLVIALAVIYLLYANLDLLQERVAVKTEAEVKSSLDHIVEQSGAMPATSHEDPLVQEELNALSAERQRIMRERIGAAMEQYEKNR